jgi:hypothetical protein
MMEARGNPDEVMCSSAARSTEECMLTESRHLNNPLSQWCLCQDSLAEQGHHASASLRFGEAAFSLLRPPLEIDLMLAVKISGMLGSEDMS